MWAAPRRAGETSPSSQACETSGLTMSAILSFRSVIRAIVFDFDGLILDAGECLRCRDDVAHAKPEPDLYIAVLECLGVGASEAIAIEDSPHGITAAKRAGMRCVAIPNSITARLDLSHADVTLTSLADVTLQQLPRGIDRP